MRRSSHRLHLFTALALLVGWGQQLCAEVGMVCLDTVDPSTASAPAEAEPTSCHDTEPVPVPEPQPMMACCQTTDAVIESAAVRAPEPVADRTLYAVFIESTLGSTGNSSWVPAPPPKLAPDLLLEYCRLII